MENGSYKTKTDQENRQPTIQTWLQKIAITQHLKQTTKDTNIHTPEQPMTQTWEKQWKEKWQQRKLLLNTKQPSQEQQNTLERYLYYQIGGMGKSKYKNTFSQRNTHNSG